MKKQEQNSKKCQSIKENIVNINKQIDSLYKIISEKKKEISNKDTQKTILTQKMKNMMVKYGVSLDFIADTFMPNPALSILKSLSDLVGAPQARDIEKMMNAISSFEKEIEKIEKDIMAVGLKLRRLQTQREDLVREMRFLGCSRIKA